MSGRMHHVDLDPVGTLKATMARSRDIDALTMRLTACVICASSSIKAIGSRV